MAATRPGQDVSPSLISWSGGPWTSHLAGLLVVQKPLDSAVKSGEVPRQSHRWGHRWPGVKGGPWVLRMDGQEDSREGICGGHSGYLQCVPERQAAHCRFTRAWVSTQLPGVPGVELMTSGQDWAQGLAPGGACNGAQQELVQAGPGGTAGAGRPASGPGSVAGSCPSNWETEGEL